jgi:hypothetical protein
VARIDDIGTPRGFSNLPWGWAQAANTPFQRYKQNTHFGGIRDPLIIHWPARIKDTGAIRSQFHHISDLTPTLLEALNLKAPETYRGVPQLPVAGVSLAYTFGDGNAAPRKKTQYFEMIGHRAIWHEGWTAVTAHVRGTPFEQDTWELYNTTEDFSAVHNLAATYPDKLKELEAVWISRPCVTAKPQQLYVLSRHGSMAARSRAGHTRQIAHDDGGRRTPRHEQRRRAGRVRQLSQRLRAVCEEQPAGLRVQLRRDRDENRITRRTAGGRVCVTVRISEGRRGSRDGRVVRERSDNRRRSDPAYTSSADFVGRFKFPFSGTLHKVVLEIK